MTVCLRRWEGYCEPCDMDILLTGIVYMLARHIDEDATTCSLACPSCAGPVTFTRKPWSEGLHKARGRVPASDDYIT